MQFDLPLANPNEFKNWLMQKPHMQGDCPCCGRFAKVYKRKLNSTLASQLIKFYRIGGADKFVHSRNIVLGTSTGDFGKAKHWGLIYAKENESDVSKTSGMWRLTKKGVEFVEGKVGIYQYALIYLDKVIDYSGPLIGIGQCLEDKFNYRELMGTA